MAPKSKATTAESNDADDTIHAGALSSALRKGHVSRTRALFNGDSISDYTKDASDSIGLDQNMWSGMVIGLVSHVLNPCARFCDSVALCSLNACRCAPASGLAGKARYRQSGKVVHETWVLLWILIAGDSGVGKSKVSLVAMSLSRC